MLKLSLAYTFFISAACTAIPGAGQEDPQELRERIEELERELVRSRLEIFALRLEKERESGDPEAELPIILRDGLGSPFPELHRQAFLELGKLPIEERKKALETVLRQWETGDELFRVDALPFLNGVDDPAANAVIFSGARDASPDVRRTAAGMLKTTEGDRAFSLLVDLLRDSHGEVRAAAIEALGVPKNEAAVAPLLVRIRREKEPALLEKASHALGVIGSDRAVPGLLRVLSSPNENVQWAAINSLGKIGDPASIGKIQPFLEPAHSLHLRKIAITTLGRLKDGDSLETFLTLLKEEPDAELREVAASAIGRLEDPRALDTTLQCFAVEKSNPVRKAIWKTVLRLAGENFERLEKVLLAVLVQEKISPIEEVAGKIYALDLNGSRRLPVLVKTIAQRMFEAKEWRRALLHYRKLVGLLPGDREGHRRTSRCYIELGDTESAIRSLESAASLAGDRSQAWWELQEEIMTLMVGINEPTRIVERSHDLLNGKTDAIPKTFRSALERNYRNASETLLLQLREEDGELRRAAIARAVRLGKRILLPLADRLVEAPCPGIIEAGNGIAGTNLPGVTTEEGLLEKTSKAWRAWHDEAP